MNKDQVNQYLEKAVEFIQAVEHGNFVKKEYQSHINGMGTAIRLYGKTATFASYMNSESDASKYKKYVLNWVIKLLNLEIPDVGTLKDNDKRAWLKDDSKLILQSDESYYDALVALKMAMRIFHIKEDKN